MNQQLLEILIKLKIEIPQLKPIRIGTKIFNFESNNILESQ